MNFERVYNCQHHLSSVGNWGNGWYIYNGNIKVVSFIIKNGRKLTIGVKKVNVHQVEEAVSLVFIYLKQHGFRRKRSCETQLVTTIQKIAQNLTSKGQVDVILLDFAKAFDKVPHRRLLHKLKFYGVDGTTLAWISSFLSSRKQLVLLDGVKSSEKEVLSGVPQGTVLRPLLFLSFINDLPDVTTSSDACLFADDCLFYRHVNSQNDSDLLQNDLSALEKWEEEWQMSFHPQKCTVIRIATNQRHVIPTQYTLHGHTLEVVDSAKYLGVTISEDLQWSKHIDNTVSKANRTMGFIRRNLTDCTKPVKAAAYTTMARPTLEYASTVWDPHSSAETHKLEQVQRRAARFVHNNYTERTPGCVTHMVQNLGWQPLQQRRYNNRLIIMFKIIHELVDVQTDVITTGVSRTRGSNRLYQTVAQKDVYKFSFFTRTIREWNLLPASVTDADNLEEFRVRIQNLPEPLYAY